jgi:hypothetical protein
MPLTRVLIINDRSDGFRGFAFFFLFFVAFHFLDFFFTHNLAGWQIGVRVDLDGLREVLAIDSHDDAIDTGSDDTGSAKSAATTSASSTARRSAAGSGARGCRRGPCSFRGGGLRLAPFVGLA